jgi:hypothetical protein
MKMPTRKLIWKKRLTGHGSPKSPQRQGCLRRKRKVLLREPDLPLDLPLDLLLDLPLDLPPKRLPRVLRVPRKRLLRPPHSLGLPLRA